MLSGLTRYRREQVRQFLTLFRQNSGLSPKQYHQIALPRSTARVGGPAVPDGSPSSLIPSTMLLPWTDAKGIYMM